jgi:hypothetical protein
MKMRLTLDPERLDDLISRHFDGDLSADEERELTQALTASVEARARMASFMRLEGATARLANASLIGSARDLLSTHSSRRFRSRRHAVRPAGWPAYAKISAAAAACVALAAVLYLYGRSSAPEPEPVLARLAADAFGVRVTRGEKTWTADKGLDLRSGDLLKCAQPLALKLTGQETSFDAGADAEFSVTQTERGLRINLKHGTLSATVAPQPPGKPMIFETPYADAEVLGTRLTLICNDDTRLEVQHGRVRLTRRGDGKFVDVGAGSFAVAGNAGGELTSQTLTATAAPATSNETVRALVFIPDSHILLCSGNAKNAKPAVIAVDCDTNKPIATYPADIGAVTSMAVSPDGQTLACGADDRSVKLYDTATHRLLKKVGSSGADGAGVRCVQFSADGEWLAWCGDKQLHVWNVKSEHALKFPPQDSDVLAISLHPNSKALASGDASGKVKIWSLDTGAETDTLPDNEKGISAIAFTKPTGISLVVGSLDTTVTMWRMSNKSVWHTQKEFQTPHSFSFLSDGMVMMIGCDDGTLRYWRQPATGIEEYSTVAHRAAISAQAMSQYDILATAATDGEVKLWDAAFPQSSATLHPFAEP